MIIDIILEFLRETGAALAIWGLAVLFPFRQMARNQELHWDIFAVLAVSLFAFVASSAYFFLYGFGERYLDTWYTFLNEWPFALQVVTYVLLADMLAYWAHRLLHTPLLWHSHAFHHSPKHLYVLSGARASFVHIAVLFAGPVAMLVLIPVYEAPIVFALIVWLQVANQHYIHSNLAFPFARYLEYLLVTPRFHFVHHSVDRRFSDTNFGFVFSLWDRLFGTYTAPEDVADDQPLGLDYENSNLRLLAGLPPSK